MRRGLLATREELTHLGERVGRKPFDLMYESLRKRCALILESHPISETDWRTMYARGRWGAALTAVRTAQGRIFDLAISNGIDRNQAYRDRAIEEMKSLASWSTWVDPSLGGAGADLCTGECCATMAVALDWLAEDLAETDRARCVLALREKGINTYLAAVQADAWWYTCYHNWNAVVNGGCALAALALRDDDAQASLAYDKAQKGLEHFFDALGREGGWDEGLGYWGYAMRYLLLLGEAMDRQLGDHSLTQHRGMEATSQFGVYFSPRGQSASFGDTPAAPLYGALYGFVKHYGSREVCWWLDSHAFHRDVATTGWSDLGLAILLRPTGIPMEPKPELSPVKVFNDIGWAAMADRWPEPNLYVSVKTGDLSAHHSQMDMNSIQLQLDGEMLLTDLGSPPDAAFAVSADRARFYETQSRAHNTIVTGDREQRIDAQGQIVLSQENHSYRYVLADAGAAMGENVRFYRHVVMLLDKAGQGQMVVVLDDVSNASAEPLEAYWHTFGQVQCDAAACAGVISGKLSTMCFRIAASSPITCQTRSNKVAAFTDNSIVVASPGQLQLRLLTVFSREPVASAELSTTKAGAVEVKLPQATLFFQGDRGRLRLERVEKPAT